MEQTRGRGSGKTGSLGYLSFQQIFKEYHIKGTIYSLRFYMNFILLIFSGKGLVQSQTSANETNKIIHYINKEEYLKLNKNSIYPFISCHHCVKVAASGLICYFFHTSLSPLLRMLIFPTLWIERLLYTPSFSFLFSDVLFVTEMARIARSTCSRTSRLQFP